MALEPESVAVCLLHAYRHPEHEQALGEALAEHGRPRLASATRSSARSASTSARRPPSSTPRSPPCSPPTCATSRERAQDAGLPEPAVMQSSGGLAIARAGRRPRRADRALRPRRRRGRRRLGRPRGGRAGHAVLRHGRHELRRLRRARRRGARGVGPRGRRAARSRCRCSTSTPSAPAAARSPGATRAARCASARAAPARGPGPAAYGHGGEEPTVTDANLLLGLLGGIAGGIELDREAAANGRRRRSATQLGLDERETAEGIIRVANAEMVRALRVMTVERGVDPRKLALMAFGGAGGLHAAAIAEELGITKILCPRASGVLAALGLVVSERRRDAQRSVLLQGRRAQRRGRRAGASGRARSSATTTPTSGSSPSCATAARRSSSRCALSDHLEEDFHAAHEEAYGYRDPEAEVELVTLRATATTPGPEIDPKAVGEAAEGAERSRRDTLYGDTEIITRRAGARRAHRRPGGRRAARGDARRPAGLERRGAGVGHDPDRDAVSLDPVTLRVASGALRAACEEMGAVLIRASHSANIKERRDASLRAVRAPTASW